jgi:CDP-paratose 2-epimerase
VSGVRRYALITGGAGFIGTNLADRLASTGQRVLIFDDLSRPGVKRNLEWLLERHGDLGVEAADVLDSQAVARAVRHASEIYHLAAQVAVTTSLADPLRDLEVNVRGTLNVLEAMRAQRTAPPFIFTSTNKVYGALEDVELAIEPSRYQPSDPAIRASGIGEARPLAFHSPYGCSKGAADQYVLDYARCFGLTTAVFRMSCIYGPHQQGNEDQGWVAHFILRARERLPVTLFGDGRQVRDVLYVDDLIDAFLAARHRMDALSGRAFNIGGGPGNTTSLLELLALLAEQNAGAATVHHSPWRNGDQRYYVSDTSAFERATGWKARVPMHSGVVKLCEWFAQRGAESRPFAVAAGQ